MYFITTKRMLEVCFSAHPNIQYRTENSNVFTALYFYDAYLVAPKKSTSPPAEQFSASERCSFLISDSKSPCLTTFVSLTSSFCLLLHSRPIIREPRIHHRIKFIRLRNEYCRAVRRHVQLQHAILYAVEHDPCIVPCLSGQDGPA